MSISYNKQVIRMPAAYCKAQKHFLEILSFETDLFFKTANCDL